MKAITAFRASRFGRFAGVGAVNTCIDVALYSVLVAAGLPSVLANLCSTSAGLAFSFVANRRYTFRVERAVSPRDVVAFVGVTGVGLWGLQPLVLSFTSDALPVLGGSLLGIVFPKLVAVAVGVAWNWVWYSRLLFRSARVMDTSANTEAALS